MIRRTLLLALLFFPLLGCATEAPGPPPDPAFEACVAKLDPPQRLTFLQRLSLGAENVATHGAAVMQRENESTYMLMSARAACAGVPQPKPPPPAPTIIVEHPSPPPPVSLPSLAPPVFTNCNSFGNSVNCISR